MPTLQGGQCSLKNKLNISPFARSFFPFCRPSRLSLIYWRCLFLLFLLLNMDNIFICDETETDFCVWRKSSFGVMASAFPIHETTKFLEVQLIPKPLVENTKRWLCVTKRTKNIFDETKADVKACHNSSYQNGPIVLSSE